MHQGTGRVSHLEKTQKLLDPLAPGPKYASYVTVQVLHLAVPELCPF